MICAELRPDLNPDVPTCETCEHKMYRKRLGWSYPECGACSGRTTNYSNWTSKLSKVEPMPEIVVVTGRLLHINNEYQTFDCKTCGLPVDGNIFCSEACQSFSSKRLVESVKSIKDRGCYICGYNKCHNALNFHHIDDKNRAVSQMKYYHELVYEIETCCVVILCNNCHSEVHSKISTDICLGWLSND